MSNIDPNQWLQSQGGVIGLPAVFDTIGSVLVGRILEPPKMVRTSLDGKETDSMVIPIEATEKSRIVVGKLGERRPAVSGDVVSLWVKPGLMGAAVANAVSDAGAHGLAVGGMLALQYTGDGARQPGKNPPKQYVAKYQAPVHEVSVADLLGPSTPVAAVPSFDDEEPF